MVNGNSGIFDLENHNRRCKLHLQRAPGDHCHSQKFLKNTPVRCLYIHYFPYFTRLQLIQRDDFSVLIIPVTCYPIPYPRYPHSCIRHYGINPNHVRDIFRTAPAINAITIVPAAIATAASPPRSFHITANWATQGTNRVRTTQATTS